MVQKFQVAVSEAETLIALKGGVPVILGEKEPGPSFNLKNGFLEKVVNLLRLGASMVQICFALRSEELATLLNFHDGEVPFISTRIDKLLSLYLLSDEEITVESVFAVPATILVCIKFKGTTGRFGDNPSMSQAKLVQPDTLEKLDKMRSDGDS